MPEQTIADTTPLNESPVIQVDSSAPAATEQQQAAIKEPAVVKAGEEIKDSKITFEDFLEIPKENQTKDEPKKTVATAEPTKVVVEPAAAKVDPATPQGRDYSEIEEGDQKLFRDMSKQSFERLKPIYLEHKRLAAEKTQLAAEKTQLTQKIVDLEKGKRPLPESYLEHPEAYTLTEEWSNGTSQLQSANLEKRHYQQQLINIREGKKWQELHVNEKGQYFLGKEQDATPTADVHVSNQLQLAGQIVNETSADLNRIRGSFSQRHSAVVQGVRKVEDEYFPQYKELKEGDPHKPAIDAVVNAFHAKGFKNNPLVGLLAKSYAHVKALENENANLKQAATTKAAIQDDKKKAGPSGGELQTVDTKVGTNAITMDDFEKEFSR